MALIHDHSNGASKTFSTERQLVFRKAIIWHLIKRQNVMHTWKVKERPKTNIELTISKFQEMITQDPGGVYSYLLLLYHVALNTKKANNLKPFVVLNT